MIEIKIIKDPYDLKHYLYKTATINLNEGFTVIIGRNGCGKTTFCWQLAEHCKKQNIPYYKYDNYKQGGTHAHSEYSFLEDFDALSSTLFHSEGEQIFYNLGRQVQNISSLIKEHKDSKQLVIILDALDSGFDVEGIGQLKNIANIMVEDCRKNNIELYVVITANNYALIHKNSCMDVRTGEYHYFDNYEAYEKFILDQYEKDRKAEAKRKKKEQEN